MWIKKEMKIIFLSILFVLSIILNEWGNEPIISISVMTLLTILSGTHIFKKALMDLKYKMIGIDLLVSIAVIAAFIIGDYFEAAAVTYLFTLGHILEKKSLEKTRHALKSLLDLKPSFARRIDQHHEEMIAYEALNIDDILLVKQGEKIPTDGNLIEGVALVDEQILTGESTYVEKNIGELLLGSTILRSGYLKMKVTKTGEDTTLARMIHMVEEAQDEKAKTQKFMETFASYYTPFIVLLSFVMFIITLDIRLAITLLVISCPGALVIATPVSFVCGIGNAAKKGILFKGGDSIERLSKGNIIFFDKTGTLTIGKPQVKAIITYQEDELHLLKIAAIGESYSEHPISLAIIEKAKDEGITLSEKPIDAKHMIGKGLTFLYNETKYYLGNLKLMPIELTDQVDHDISSFEALGYTTIILSNEEQILAIFGISDSIRPKAKELIKDLSNMGIKEQSMLTGDRVAVAKHIATELKLTSYHASLLPEDKKDIIKSYQQKGFHTIFVGDGINDALALTYADASVAVGGIGKDLAMETADVVLMSEDIFKLKDALMISRIVKRNMIQNIGFALIVVIILMIGVIFKQVSMSLGMLVHELSVILVLLNATRLLGYQTGGLNEKRIRTSKLYRESSNF